MQKVYLVVESVLTEHDFDQVFIDHIRSAHLTKEGAEKRLYELTVTIDPARYGLPESFRGKEGYLEIVEHDLEG